MTFGDIKTVGELLLVLNQFDPELKVKIFKDGMGADIWHIEECEDEYGHNILKLIG